MSNTRSFPTKFKVSNQTAENVSNSRGESASTSTITSQLKPYKHNHCTEVLTETQFSARVKASRNNGFVQTVIECYNKHHNLVIRPDDIWTAILTQFSFYINKNAEEFRSKFVNFNGKKELVVQVEGSLRSATYGLFVNEMTEKIDENLVDKTVKNWILPSFSTTTANDIISCGVVFMASTKMYFEFTRCLACGIPYVTLEGTIADWEAILNRLEKLKEYKLDKWYDLLKPILKEFVAAKQGRADLEFWKRICHHLGDISGPSYISGWLTVFAVFDEDGNWTDLSRKNSWINRTEAEGTDEPWPVLNIAKIPSGIVNVDVKIIDRNKNYESVMFSGHVGYEVFEDDCTLKPRIGWGIALKLSADDVEKLHADIRGKNKRYCEQCNKQLRC
ncbi:uncharacterized protein LOC119070502 [Bradysia coprophila]|uniref:uncharacterized protein LOC119070502 n=1 Tax=Bradysia coprophila TaxID=38358 RepID=UPI00187DBB23|nr:uncharacterized protein LOC119070502 [Bradysia coprophila]